MQNNVLHLGAGKFVTQHGQGRARLHKRAFQICINMAYFPFFRGADGFGVTFALQRGHKGAGFFLPEALRAQGHVPLVQSGEGHAPRMRGADDDFAVGRGLDFVQQCGDIDHNVLTIIQVPPADGEQGLLEVGANLPSVPDALDVPA